MSDKAPYSVQYRIETGYSSGDWAGYFKDYVKWLEQRLFQQENITALAVARFRAGEKIFEQYGMTTDIMKSGYYRRLKHAISAYEAEVKGERSGHTKVR